MIQYEVQLLGTEAVFNANVLAHNEVQKVVICGREIGDTLLSCQNEFVLIPEVALGQGIPRNQEP